MATTKSVGFAVDAPPLVAAPYGLINEWTLQPDDVRWEGGVGFESLACAAKIDLWGICTPDGITVADGTGNERGVYAPAFAITATDTCTSTFGSDFRERAESRARELLEAATPKAVESEFKWGWQSSSAAPAGRWLTGPLTQVVDATGLKADCAAALLLDAYAGCSYGGGAVLHASPGAAYRLDTNLGADFTINGEPAHKDTLYTDSGVPVIVGAGYAPNGSELAPWDGNWMFVTGPPMVWLGEIQVYPDNIDQAVNVATNDIRFKAERLAAVTFDGCCVFAAKVDVAKC